MWDGKSKRGTGGGGGGGGWGGQSGTGSKKGGREFEIPPIILYKMSPDFEVQK